MRDNNKPEVNFDAPGSENIESRLLYEIITEPEFVPEVRRIVAEDAFSDAALKRCYASILAMFDNGETIDFETVIPRLPQGCFSKISAHAMDTYNEGVISHAESLRDTHIRRVAFFSALNLLNGISDGCDTESILEMANSIRDGAMQKYGGESAALLSDVINEVGAELEKGDARKIPTGIKPLDFLFYKGLDEGDLVIVAARPSVGKTTMALQMARYEANLGLYPMIFTLEMTKRQIAKRILMATGELKPFHLFGGTMDWKAFEKAVASTKSENIIVNDSARSVSEICSTITMAKQSGKCDVVYIDYLGLINLPSDKSATTAQLIGRITTELKHCAMRNGIPIVLLCQLNRQSVAEGRSPRLNDLRDSGNIEQDADRVIMLERPITEGDGNYIDMWVRKNRNGKGGDICIHLKGDENYSNFEEYEK